MMVRRIAPFQSTEACPKSKLGRSASLCTLYILIASSGAFISCFNRGSALDRGMNAIVKAYAKRRTIEPRLSGGFLAGEYRPGRDPDLVDQGQLERSIELIAAAPERDDTQGMLIQGRLALLRGQNSQAAKCLRSAARAMPSNAQAHNDLGACLYEEGNFDGALDEFEIASACSPSMPEAVF